MTKNRPPKGRPVPHLRKTREEAECLAIAALQFLAGDARRLANFLSSSGIAPEALRASATSPEFLGGVLEHLGSDERLLLDFADHAGVDPADIDRAREELAGGTWEPDTP